MSRPPTGLFRRSVLASAIAGLAFSHSAPAVGNPSGADVVRGDVDFQTFGNELTITNSNGAIIHWQDFSIAQDEITRFQQEAANSAVLNRVVGGDVSEILGQLVSNGQVFLINPNGVVFGQDVTIDTAGFVASTLDMANEDFLAGNFLFQDGGSAGRIVNEGYLTTRGGNVFFVAADIENSGIVHTEDGSLVLAAGERVRIRSLDTPDIEFEVASPENEIVNLGALLADQGAVKAFAGTLTHSGEVRADSVTLGDDGSIVLYAQDALTLEADSVVAASGATGGDVLVQSEAGTVLAAGRIEAEGRAGAGGRIRLLGERVGVIDQAVVSADGTAGGGEILVGGNLKGLGPEPNADAVFVGADTNVTASATEAGDGGRVIAFGENLLRMEGVLSARGGPLGGDGGFVETSALRGLEISAVPDVRAPAGSGGRWLIDPEGIRIVPDGTATPPLASDYGGYGGPYGGTVFSPSDPFGFDTNDLEVGLIDDALDGGATVDIDTTLRSTFYGGIVWDATLNLETTAAPAGNGTGNLLRLLASEDVIFTGNGAINDPDGSLAALEIIVPDGALILEDGSFLDLPATSVFIDDAPAEPSPRPLLLQGGTLNALSLEASSIATTPDAVGTESTLSIASPVFAQSLTVLPGTDLDIAASQFTVFGSLQISGALLGSGGTVTFNGESDGVLGDVTGGLTELSDVTVVNDGFGFAVVGDVDFSLGARLRNNGDLLADSATPVVLTDADGDIDNALIHEGGETSFVIGGNPDVDLTIAVPFTQDGFLDVEEGTLRIASKTQSTNGIRLGTVGQSSTEGTLRIVDDGVLVMEEGGSIAPRGPGPGIANFVLDGGVLDLQSGSPLTLDALEFDSGTIRGSGDLTIFGTLNWLGGVIEGSGDVEIQSFANLTGQNGAMEVRGTRRFDNGGTITWTGGDIILGERATLANTSVFDIARSAATSIGVVAPDPDPLLTARLENTGTITKTDAQDLTIEAFVGQSGSFNSTDGVLRFDGGSLQAGILDPGVGPNSEILFGNGTHQLGPDTNLSGDVRVQDGTVDATMGTNLTIGRVDVDSGELVLRTGSTLTTTDALSISGSVAVEGATLAVGGPLELQGGEDVASLTISGAALSVTNGGSASTAVIDLEAGGSIIFSAGLFSFGEESEIKGAGFSDLVDFAGAPIEVTASESAFVLAASAQVRDRDFLGTGNFTVTDEFTLFGANSFGGTLLVDAGTLRIVNDFDSGAASLEVGSFTANNGGRLELSSNTEGPGFGSSLTVLDTPAVFDGATVDAFGEAHLIDVTDAGASFTGGTALNVGGQLTIAGGAADIAFENSTVDLDFDFLAVTTTGALAITGTDVTVDDASASFSGGTTAVADASFGVQGVEGGALAFAGPLSFGTDTTVLLDPDSSLDADALAVTGTGVLVDGGIGANSLTIQNSSDITFNGTVSIAGATSVASSTATFNNTSFTDSLSLSNATLNVNGSLDVADGFIQAGGTVGGSGDLVLLGTGTLGTTQVVHTGTGRTIVAQDATVNLTNTLVLGQSRTLLVNAGDGMTTFDGVLSVDAGNIALGDTSTLDNFGVIDLNGSNSIVDNTGGPIASFFNQGTLNKNGGGQISQVNVDVFQNSGTINSFSGRLDVFGAEHLPGATLNTSSASYRAVGAHSFTGTTFNGGLTVSGSTASFLDDTGTPGVDAYAIADLVQETSTLTGDADIVLTGMALIGASGASVQSGTGRTIVAPDATLTLNNTLVVGGSRTLRVEAGDGMTTTDGLVRVDVGNLALGDTSLTENFGLIELDGTSSIVDNTGGATAQLSNDGTIRKLGPGVAQINVDVFQNRGIVDANQGRLDVFGAEYLAGSTLSSSSTTYRAVGNHSFTGTSFTGGLTINGSTSNFLDDAGTPGVDAYAISDLVQNVATIGGDADLLLTGSAEIGSGGQSTQIGTGRTIVAPDAVLTMNNTLVLGEKRTLRIDAGDGVTTADGILRMDVGNLALGDTSVVSNFGQLQLNGTTSIVDNTGGLTASLLNDGTITKLGSGLASQIGVDVFQNTGVVRSLEGRLDVTNADYLSGGILDTSSATYRAIGTHDFTGTSFTGGLTINGSTSNFLDDAGTPGVDAYAISDLVQNVATIGGDADLLLTGSAEIGSGGQSTQTGTGRTIVAPDAVLTMNNTLVLGGSRTLRTDAGDGVTTFDGTLRIDAGNLALADTSTLQNDGITELTGNVSVLDNTGGPVASFFNTGTVAKSGSGTTSTIAPDLFQNDGLVDVTDGLLSLSGTSSSSGSFAVAATGDMQSGGTLTLQDGASIDGGGLLRITSGSTTIASAGTVTADGLRLQGGTLTVDGTLNSTREFVWDGGTIDGTGGLVDIDSAATLDIVTASAHTLRGSVTLDNRGTADWTGNNIQLGDTALLRNTGSFAIRTDADVTTIGGTPFIQNDGAITKTDPGFTGTTSIAVPLDNDGTMSASSGIIQLDGDGLHDGDFLITPPGDIVFGAGATHTVNGDIINSLGDVIYNGQVLTLNGTVVANTVTVEAGSDITFDGNYSATATTVDASAVSFNGTSSTGDLTVNGGSIGGLGTLAVSGTATLNGATFRDMATTTFTAGSMVSGTGATVVDTAGVIFQGALAIDALTASGGRIDVATTGATTNLIVNGGTVASDGLLDLNGSLGWSAGTIGGGSGTIRLTSTATGTIDTAAPKTLDSGTLTVDSTAGVVWSDGNMEAVGGGILEIGGLLVSTHNDSGGFTLAPGASATGTEALEIGSGGVLRRNGGFDLSIGIELGRAAPAAGLVEALSGGLNFDDFATLGATASVVANQGTIRFRGDGTADETAFTATGAGVIDFGAAFMLNDATLDGTGTFTGDPTLNATLTTIDSPITLRDASITTTGTLAIDAALTLEGSVSIDGAVTNNDLLLIQGVDDGGTPLDAVATLPSLNNLGTMRLTSVGAAAGATIDAAGLVTSSGTIEVLQGAGGARTIEGGFELTAGTFDVQADTTLRDGGVGGVTFGGTSLTQLAGGTTLTIDQDGEIGFVDLVDTAAIQLGGLSQLRVVETGSTSPTFFTWQDGATIAGTGTFDVIDTVVDIQGTGGHTVDGAVFLAGFLTLDADEVLEETNGGVLGLSGTTFVDGGAIRLNGGSASFDRLELNGSTSAGALLDVQGGSAFVNAGGFATFGGITLGSTGNLDLTSGRFEFSDASFLDGIGTLAVTAGEIEVSAASASEPFVLGRPLTLVDEDIFGTGFMDLTSTLTIDGGGFFEGTLKVDGGTVSVENFLAPADFTVGSLAVVNGGTLRLTTNDEGPGDGSTVHVDNGPVIFDGAIVETFGALHELDVTNLGAAFSNSSTLAVDGELTIIGGSADLTFADTITTADFGALTLSNSGAFTSTDSSWSISSADAVFATGSAVLTGSDFTVTNGGGEVFRFDSPVTEWNAGTTVSLSLGATMTAQRLEVAGAGTEQISGGSLNVDTLVVETGTDFTVGALLTAATELRADGGALILEGAATTPLISIVDGSVTVNGLATTTSLTSTAGDLQIGMAADLDVTGAATLDGLLATIDGTLDFQSTVAGTGATFAGSGSTSFGASGFSLGTLEVGGGTVSTAGSANAGTLVLDGGTLLNDGLLQVSNAFDWRSGEIGGPATLEVSGTASGLIGTAGSKTVSGGDLVIESNFGNPTVWIDGDILLTGGARMEVFGGRFVAAGDADSIAPGIGNTGTESFGVVGGIVERDGTGSLSIGVRTDIGAGSIYDGIAGDLSVDAFATIGGDLFVSGGTLFFTADGVATGSTISINSPGAIDFGTGFTLDGVSLEGDTAPTGTFTLIDPNVISSPMTFQNATVTVPGAELLLAAPVTLNGTVTFDGPVRNEDQLSLVGTSDFGDALGIFPELTNSALGTIVLTNDTAGRGATLQVNGAFDNAGFIQLLPGAGGGFREILGALSMTGGELGVFTNGRLSGPGLFTIGGDSSLFVADGFDFTIEKEGDSGGGLLLTDNAAVNIGIGGNVILVDEGSTPALFTWDGDSTIEGPGTLDADQFDVSLGADTLTLNGAVFRAADTTNPAIVVPEGGELIIRSAGALDVEGAVRIQNGTLRIDDGDLFATGAIEVDGTGGTSARLLVDQGSLDIQNGGYLVEGEIVTGGETGLSFSGGTFDFRDDARISGDAEVALNTDFNIVGAVSGFTLASQARIADRAIGGSGVFRIENEVTVEGASSFAGSVDVDGGRLRILNDASGPASFTVGALSVLNGGALEFATNDEFGGNGSTLTVLDTPVTFDASDVDVFANGNVLDATGVGTTLENGASLNGFGELTIRGALTIDLSAVTGTTTGSLTVENATQLDGADFAGAGTVTFEDAVSGSGALFSGTGSTSFSTAGFTLGTLTLNDGQLTTEGVGAVTDLTIGNGTLVANDPVAVNGSLTMTGGVITGDDVVTFSGASGTLSGGVLQGGTDLVVSDDSTLVVTGPVTLGEEHILQIDGTLNLTENASVLNLGDNASLVVGVDGLVDFSADGDIVDGANGMAFLEGSFIENAGTIRKTGGTTGESILSAETLTTQPGSLLQQSANLLVVDSFATVNGDITATAGTLRFQGGGVSTDSQITVNAGATLDFGGDFTFNNPTISGAGTVLGGPGLLMIVDDALTFTDTDIQTAGTLRITEFGSLTLEGTVNVDGDVTNEGLLTIFGSSDAGGATVTLPSLDNLGSLVLTSDGGTGASPELFVTGAFTSSGSIRVFAAGGGASLNGALELTGGTLDIEQDLVLDPGSAGGMVFGGDSVTTVSPDAFVVARVNDTAPDFVLGAGATLDLDCAPGSCEFAIGDQTALGTGRFVLDGGTIRGAGLVDTFGADFAVTGTGSFVEGRVATRDLTILEGARLDLRAGGNIAASGTTRVEGGNLTVDGATLALGGPLELQGLGTNATLNVSSATLNVDIGGFAEAAAIGLGAGGNLTFGDGVFSFRDDSAISGEGAVQFAGAVVDIDATGSSFVLGAAAEATNQVFGGTGNLLVTDTFTLRGANSFGGAMRVENGALVLPTTSLQIASLDVASLSIANATLDLRNAETTPQSSLLSVTDGALVTTSGSSSILGGTLASQGLTVGAGTSLAATGDLQVDGTLGIASGADATISTADADAILIDGGSAVFDGTVTADSLELFSGDAIFQGTANLDTATVLGGTASFQGTLISTDTTVSGGSAAFAGTLTTDSLDVSGGNLASAGLIQTVTASVSAGSLETNGTFETSGLALGGGQLLGSGQVDVSNLLDWTGGAISGSGTLTVGSEASGEIDGSGVDLAGWTLANEGFLELVDTSVTLSAGATVANRGQLALSGVSGFATTDAGTRFQSGADALVTANVTSGRGVIGDDSAARIADMSVEAGTVDLDGAVQLQSGSLAILADAGSLSAAFTGTADTSLVLVGPQTLEATGSITVPQLELLGFGTAGPTMDGAITTDALALAGDVTLNSALSVPELLIAASTAPATGEVFLPTVTANADIEVTGTFTHSGGTLTGPGTTTVAAGATLTSPGGFSRGLADHRLVHASTTGASVISDGRYTLDGTARLENLGTLELDASSSNALELTGSGSLLNGGSLNVDPGAGTTGSIGGEVIVDADFTNDGTVTLERGFLRLLAGGTHTGSFVGLTALDGSTASRLRLEGEHLFTAASSTSVASFGVFAGDTEVLGDFDVQSVFVGGGSLELASGVDVELFGLETFDSAAPASFTSAGDVNASRQFVWRGGTLGGSGAVNIGSDALAQIGDEFATAAPTLTLDGRTLTHAATAGTSTFARGELALVNGARFVNSGSLAAADPDGVAITFSGEAGTAFENTGTLTATTPLTLAVGTTNSGTLGAGTLNLTAGTTLLNSGTVDVSGTFDALGTIELADGTIVAAPLLLGATGVLAGNGTVNGQLLNSGLVSPGNSPGAITVVGDYVQTADGRLFIEIDGAAAEAGTDFDALVVTGNASFGGTLQLETLEGFQGTLGGNFVPISYGSATGTFATVQQPTNSDVVFDPVFGPNGVETTISELNGETLEFDPTNPPRPEDEEQAREFAEEVLVACPEQREEVAADNNTQRERENQQSEQGEETRGPDDTAAPPGTQGVGCVTS